MDFPSKTLRCSKFIWSVEKKNGVRNSSRLDGMKTFSEPLIYNPVHLEVFYSQEERVRSSSNFLDFSGRCWLVKKAIFLLVIPLGNAWNVLVRKVLELHGGLASGNTDVPTTYIVLMEENLHQFIRSLSQYYLSGGFFTSQVVSRISAINRTNRSFAIRLRILFAKSFSAFYDLQVRSEMRCDVTSS